MKKSITIWGFIILLVMCIWLVGFAIPANAETMKYKGYRYTLKNEDVKVGDVEGHLLRFQTGRAFLVFENGETATSFWLTTADYTKDLGSAFAYITITFVDDRSTIVTKIQSTWDVSDVAGLKFTAEIIKGTGRFEGIKGTQTSKYKLLPLEEGEVDPKGIGEGTFNYTLPSK